ncbi:hypothetical protein ABKN59_003930 [Abortiporus biennis]
MDDEESTPSQSRIPLSISGSIVGIIDPTQKERLLSSPDSKLSFATFHPRTASATSDRKLSTREELCSSKRIVIETLSTGESFWRWVPKARGVETVEDEGQWPRVIIICGQHVHCSQEQWDIYKLDPEYDCFVQHHPKPTIISKAKGKERAKPEVLEEKHGKKRVQSPDSSDIEPMPGDFARTTRRKVNLATIDEDSSDEEEDEVAEMIVDGANDASGSRTKESLKKERHLRHEKMAKERNSRREKLHAKTMKSTNSLHDLNMVDLTLEEDDDVQSAFPESSTVNFSGKRATGEQSESATATKRARTRSPPKSKPMRFATGTRRLKNWQQKYNERISIQRELRDQSFMQSLYGNYTSSSQSSTQSNDSGFSSSSQGSSHTNGNSHTNGTSNHANSQPEEDPVSLEEKIRRMAELNAYEEVRAKKEAQRKKAEEMEKERARQEEELRARMEKERLRQEEELRRRRKQQQEERWNYGPWTTQRALERYKTLADTFDTAKFTPENPFCFEDIPWPVLHRPMRYSVEDIDWGTVESFFVAVKPHMRSQDYKIFVEKSHRRFHPDRWRARRVLLSMVDDEIRAGIEVAANTVAQAITPLWREVRGG